MTITNVNEALRPTTLMDFIGQENLKSKLAPYIAEAVETRTPMCHVLLTSEPGAGKTSLAQVIAAELGDPFNVIDLSRMNDRQFTSYMRRTDGGVLLVDEIHRAKVSQQESLLTLMEEGYISNQYGGTIRVPWLTIIAATTEPHKIVPAVAARFPLRLEYDAYSDEEMAQIIEGMAFDLEAEISPDDARALGMAAGGIPRSARDLVRAWRALSFQGTPTVEGALALTEREPDGLTGAHLEYLRALDRLEGHAGERVLCSILRMHPSHLNSLERLLVTRGLISLTPTGRVLTGAGDARMRGAKEERSFRRVVVS